MAQHELAATSCRQLHLSIICTRRFSADYAEVPQYESAVPYRKQEAMSKRFSALRASWECTVILSSYCALFPQSCAHCSIARQRPSSICGKVNPPFM